ncbi:restriction endonuclease [Streptomyces sp. ME01-18a]|uniref:restriction endonuclease n=1 Tax=Streptomyces sp. ME01-18a TaxID=3028669 RepID=UPI0029AE189B|nr:restriction endonuclease [Streptomyces sp. ME01-18a]MDX3434400.1 restriction endonuclease [Streptomyces sp. ME01-18a]
MSSTPLVLHDPQAELPLDRAPHECLIKAVFGWTGNPGLASADIQQIALLFTGAARAVASDVRRAADLLPDEHAARALADVVLEEADRRLSLGIEGTVRCVQDRARLVRALYERLARLVGAAHEAASASETAAHPGATPTSCLTELIPPTARPRRS